MEKEKSRVRPGFFFWRADGRSVAPTRGKRLQNYLSTSLPKYYSMIAKNGSSLSTTRSPLQIKDESSQVFIQGGFGYPFSAFKYGRAQPTS